LVQQQSYRPDVHCLSLYARSLRRLSLLAGTAAALTGFVQAGEPDFSLQGFASMEKGTTGGGAGPTITVDNLEDFARHAGEKTGPCVVQVQGTIRLGKSSLRVGNDKTILGLGSDARLIGNLKVFRSHNVIIRNLHLTNPDRAGDRDGLTLQRCENAWVDHCTFVDCADGSLDVSQGADWITVSWCKFSYTDAVRDHRFVNLVGHSDRNDAHDRGKLRITFHHNWWADLCHERMPRVRFGRVHVFNNFFHSPGNNYCLRAARDSELRVEGNYFLDVHNPWEVYVTRGETGRVFAVSNALAGTTASVGNGKSLLVPGTDEVFAPAYAYNLAPANQVPGAVTNRAGAGRGPFAP